MPQHKVLLLGATGETGREVLSGLLEDGGFVRISIAFADCAQCGNMKLM
jgi:hypothetical protein